MTVMAVRQPRRHSAVYLVAAVVSLILSYWIAAHVKVINPDAICYLQSAAAFHSADFQTAMHLCDQATWPFYSLLIFSVAHLSSLSTTVVAFSLNGLFSLITVLTFIYLVSTLGGSRSTVWFAALVILSAHAFNGFRHDILRDHGFWAFGLLSLALLIRHLRKPTVDSAVLWSVTVLLAALFRVEGVIFLLVLPLTALFNAGKTVRQRLVSFVQLNVLTLVLGLGFLLWYVLVGAHKTVSLSRLSEIQFQITQGASLLAQHFHTAADALAHGVISPFAAHDAPTILGLTLLVWYGMNVVCNVSLIGAVLILYAGYHQLLRCDAASRLAIWAAILVNVMVTGIFLAENMFISERYLMALGLVLLLWVPFALDHLLQEWQSRRWLFPLVMLLVVISAVGGVVSFGYSKDYIREAGDWLAQNVPASATLYSNDEQVMYYSDHFGNAIFSKFHDYADMTAIAQDKWKQYNYLAIRSNKSDQESATAITLTPVQVFSNKRGDQVAIYQVSNQEITQ